MSHFSLHVLYGDKKYNPVGMDDNEQRLPNIDGRITENDLKVGQIFQYCQPLSDYENQTGLHIERISLRVTKILAYRKYFEILNKGMTCRVWLDGAGFEKLKPRMLLWTNVTTNAGEMPT